MSIDPYLDFVEKKAEENGKYFYLDSGEGHDLIDFAPGWDVENLSGWYVDLKDKEKLLEAAEKDKLDDREFLEYYVLAQWFINDAGKLDIYFEKITVYFD